MRILILTVGTRGDVQPYVALGAGLVAAGHEVSICTSQQFETFITRHGVGYLPLNNDMREFMESEDGRRAMETTTNLYQMLRTAIRLWPKVTGMMTRQINEMWAATEAFQPDLILYHKKAIGAEDFAERLGCRYGLAFYLPMFVPTGQFPAFGFPRLPLGRWYNRFTFRLIEYITRKSSAKFTKQWRSEHGLPAASQRALVQTKASDGPVALLAYSPHVIPQPADWPDTATVTGYWFLDLKTDFDPPEELTRFLAAGPPPIYVGFGSIFGLDPKKKTQAVIEGIRQSGARAILASGWGGLDLNEFDLPDTMLAIESAPHDWLFPQVAAVVHHGGCGTTAAGLRAGRPTIICPFFGDQPFWGKIVYRAGVGPKPIMQRKLTPQKLASAIRTTLNDPAMHAKAEALGALIRAEDGVANAVAFLKDKFPSA